MKLPPTTEAWLAAILAALADGVTVQDRSGKLIYANEAAAQLIGFPTVDQLLATPSTEVIDRFEIFDEQGAPFPPAQLPGRQALQGIVPSPVILRFRVKATGEEHWSLVKARPVFDTGQHAAFAVNLFHDITSLKRAEQTLEQNRRRLQAIFDHTRDAILIADDQGVTIDVNPSASALTGYRREELLERTVRDLVPGLADWMANPGLSELTERRFEEGECLVRRKDSHERIAEYRAVAHFLPGLHLLIFRDISERRRAELEREQSVARLNGIIASAMDAIISVNERQEIIVFNPAAEILFGIEADAALGQSLDRFIPDRYRQSHRAHIRRFGETGTTNRTMTSPGELVGKRASGDEFPIEATISQVVVGGERIYTVILRDISERQQAAAALAQERQLMRLLIDQLPDFVYVKDRESRFLMTNQAHARIMGALEPEAAVGKTDFDFFERSLAEKYYRDEQEVVETGEPKVNIEESSIDTSGRIMTVLTTKLPLRDEAGQVIGTVGVSRDITDRKRSEERRRFLYQMTAALSRALSLEDVMSVMVQSASQIADGHCSGLRFGGDHEGTIDRFYDPQAALPFVQHLPPILEKPMMDVMYQRQPILLETADEYRQRYSEVTAAHAGEAVPEAMACLPLFVAGRIIGCLGIAFRQRQAFGLEDRVFMEAMAIQSAQALERARLYEAEYESRVEAERANAIKLQFLGMISHELRTPLASIKGFASSLLADDVMFDATQQQEFLAIIDAEADKLTGLVSQLLDLSRLHAGSLTVTPQPVSLQQLFKDNQEQMKRLASQHTLRIALADRLPLVMADPERLLQVLMNLIDNACKYSPGGTAVEIDVYEFENAVRLDVRDQGEGIPTAHREAVFEAFKQLEQQQGRRHGAGLGLAICKGLIEAHGGRIWIADQAVSGTTVSLILPVADVPTTG